MLSPDTSRRELTTFRSLGTLRVLNVLAVGTSLATATGCVLGSLFQASGGFATVCAFSTLVFGLGWAALLRDQRTIKGTGLRWGWLASIPLAMGNAAFACVCLVAVSGGQWGMDAMKAAILGATVGAIIWFPALVFTLVVFGLPIAMAQKQAKNGLAGEERGELVIGVVAAFVSLLSLLFIASAASEGVDRRLELLFLAVLAAVGLVSGTLASLFAARRARVRRSFVREVAVGNIDGYRVDDTTDGKVLVRVTSMGSGYRVANFEEILAVLDEKGEARRGQV